MLVLPVTNGSKYTSFTKDVLLSPFLHLHRCEGTGASGRPKSGDSVSKLKQQKAAYMVPKYNFDQIEEAKKPLDIDKVLQEVEQQNEVIEIPEPVISLQLVLNVPRRASVALRGARRKSSMKGQMRGQNEGMTDGSIVQERSISERKRSVNFMAHAEESGLRFGLLEAVHGLLLSAFCLSVFIQKSLHTSMCCFTESTDSDYSEVESDWLSDNGQDQEQDDKHEQVKPRNRFAYSEADSYPGGSTHLIKESVRGSKAYVSLLPVEDELHTSFRGLVSGFESTVGKSALRAKKKKRKSCLHARNFCT